MSLYEGPSFKLYNCRMVMAFTLHKIGIFLGSLPLSERYYSKTCVKRPLKNRQNKDLNDKWWPNEGQKYCRIKGAFCNTFDLHYKAIIDLENQIVVF